MAAKRKTEKTAPKTYATIKGLLAAKAKGTLERGTHIRIATDRAFVLCGGVTVGDFPVYDFAEAMTRAAGFTLAR